ncbi:unnamed protein product [Rotaria magnacalcarata]|uniref:Uncharacterized protein n=2 Tax=Rotaria magnacalcarata TaxID=392030 RepID=A0A820EU41_9BILA|nr:unnamed protein product [Rotaria magnacalcarata]CAF4077508.1 unnamed protein product [Rotaria magnacalcarata]CAF4251368.1 unnamed protein product [Rotaria magnacalcarata]
MSKNRFHLNDLKDSSVGYLVQIDVISKFNQGSYEISECNPILYRLSSYIDIEKPYLKIFHNNHELENTNTLLMSLNENPIHSQSTVPLEDQEPSSIRHLTVKLRRTVSIAGSRFYQ